MNLFSPIEMMFSFKKFAPYGLDAPGVVLGLFSGALASAIAFTFALKMEFPTVISWILYIILGETILSLFCTGCWMLYSMLILKPRMTSNLIDELELIGNEHVLDVGCGRGLLLAQVAKRLNEGKAYGIDLWISKDQSGNGETNTLAHLKSQNLAERTELKTADMRAIPYPDHSFDAVVSSLAIHNLSKEEDRNKTLSEIFRVLKPSGKLYLFDIRHGKHYQSFIEKENLGTVLRSGPHYRYCPPITIVKATKNHDD